MKKITLTTAALILSISFTNTYAFDSKYMQLAKSVRNNSLTESGNALLTKDSLSKSLRRTAVNITTEAAAVPVTVGVASAAGATASTGTAIASLSGAAATSASVAAVGTPLVAGLEIIGITCLGPFAAGAIVIGGAAAGVAYGINSLLDD